MCGIAGLLQSDRGLSRSDLISMSKLIEHRGPDNSDHWIKNSDRISVGLSQVRLAIRDVSAAGDQPMTSRSGDLTIVYNGELYNDREIAARLKQEYGISMRSNCDTEVLLELIAAEGIEALRLVNGMYALAIFDNRSKTLTLARDLVGIKPLYIWQDTNRGKMAFASEVKAFFAFDTFSRKIDPLTIPVLLSQGYLGPGQSIMENVKSLKPGEVIQFDADQTPKQLFKMSVHEGKAEVNSDLTTLGQAADWIKPEFEAAVDRQRVSDVPLVVWQSAGIDSSLVNAACKSPFPEALTVRMNGKDFDESDVAEEVSRNLCRHHLSVEFDQAHLPPEKEFASLVWHMDGQLADSSALAVKRLSAATKSHATVVLSGDGADELFGGYQTYVATRLAHRYSPFAPTLLCHWVSRKCFAAAAHSGERYPKLDWAGRFLNGLPHGALGHAEWRRYAMPWILKKLLSPDLFDECVDGLNDYKQSIENGKFCLESVDPAVWGQFADIEYYLPGDMLMKADRMSMAHGLEVRVPFLDLHLIRKVRQIPDQLRLPVRHQGKPVLRALLAQYGLPQSITHRKKTGFNVPLALQLRTSFHNTMKHLLVENDYVSPYLDPAEVKKLVQDHMSNSADHSYLLWTLMTFSQWREHIGS